MTDARPAVAIIVPCRNYGRFLADALGSLAAQTVLPGEVVVIDDGSTDETPDILPSLLAKLVDVVPTVKAIRTEPRGLANAMRVGVEATTSPLLARLDADDMVRPRYVEKLMTALHDHPDAAYAYPAVQLIGNAEGIYPTYPFDPARLVIAGNFVTAASLVRRQAYLTSGGVADLPAWEDWDLWLRFLELGMTGVLVDEPLYLWRRHGLTMNQLSLPARRLMRLRIWGRHPRLFLRYARPGRRYFVERLLHPMRVR